MSCRHDYIRTYVRDKRFRGAVLGDRCSRIEELPERGKTGCAQKVSGTLKK